MGSMNPTTQLVEAIKQTVSHTLTNYASCRSLIRGKSPGNPDNSEFYASLLLCFGSPDISKPPIDDLHSKSSAAILLAIADAVDAEIGEDSPPCWAHDEPYESMNAGGVEIAGKMYYECPENEAVPIINQEKARMRTFTAGLREAAKL